MASRKWERAVWVLAPSLLLAAAAETVFFKIFDPVDLSLLWAPLGPRPLSAYGEGLLLFWAFTAASSAFTLLLQGWRHADGDPATSDTSVGVQHDRP